MLWPLPAGRPPSNSIETEILTLYISLFNDHVTDSVAGTVNGLFFSLGFRDPAGLDKILQYI